MNRSAPLLMLALATLAACQRETPQEKAADDARDVAMVERAQQMKPPVQPLSPGPVSFADLDTPGVDIRMPSDVPKPAPGGGCGFIAAGAGTDTPVFIAVPKFGLMKVDGELEDFAADSGSDQLSSGLHVRYSSGAHTLRLTEGDNAPDGGRKASLTIRDPHERIVYFSAGEIRCR